VPDYTVTGWSLADFSGAFGDPANAGNTTPDFAVGTTSTLSASASTVTFDITDDDPELEDAYLETGVLSVLTNNVTIGGVTYNAGQNIESEYQLISDDVPPITFIIGRIGTGTSNSGSNVVVFTTSPITAGQTFTFSGSGDGPIDPYGTLCFAGGTLIETPNGPRRIEELNAGDLVTTRDKGARPIRWLAKRDLGPLELCRNPSLRPIRIRKGALGAGLPAQDLVVSPQHRILLSDPAAELLFDTSDVLVPAQALLGNDRVHIDHACQSVSYYHLLLEDHAMVCANGQWAETLLLGSETQKTFLSAQRRELELLFPEKILDPPTPYARSLRSWEYELLR
jgi:hypothetical protein